jgi:hypothetical protein
VDLERQPGSNAVPKLAIERTIDRSQQCDLCKIAFPGRGFGPAPGHFPRPVGRKKERTTRTGPPLV